MGGREYLIRWLDEDATDMRVMDKDMSDDLLHYWWTKTSFALGMPRAK